MSAKKLDQSVFDGLPKHVRFAAVGSTGNAWVCSGRMRTSMFEWLPKGLQSHYQCGDGYDTTDWQNSLIERQDVPTADIDWSKAPEGATYYSIKNRQYYKRDGHAFMQWGGESWCRLFDFTVTDLDNMGEVVKRESITDVARSIEAARVAEKPMPYPDGDARYFETSDVPETKKYPHYFKDVSAVDAIDLYHVARLYEITDPALFHAFKKIACAGKRGAKDQAQDVQEAIDALKRWQELNK